MFGLRFISWHVALRSKCIMSDASFNKSGEFFALRQQILYVPTSIINNIFPCDNSDTSKGDTEF